jgi:hypothetical protein
MVDRALQDASSPKVRPGVSPLGDITIRTDHIRMVLEPALADEVEGLPLPIQSNSSPFRSERPDGIEIWVEATGEASSSFLGADVNCDFHASYSARVDFTVDPSADHYFERFKTTLSNEQPAAYADNCDSSIPVEFLDFMSNLIVNSIAAPFGGGLNLSLDALANSKDPSRQLRGQIADQLSQAAASANELTMMPLPFPEALRTVAIQGQQVPVLVGELIDEWRNGREMSPPLELEANGPAGSCMSGDLRQLDNGQCTITPSLERLSGLDPLLSEAVQAYVSQDPRALECRPIIGGGAYAQEVSHGPAFIQSLQAYRTLGGLGCDPYSGGFGRLFVEGGEIFAACVRDDSPACHACYTQQDSGQAAILRRSINRAASRFPTTFRPNHPNGPRCLAGGRRRLHQTRSACRASGPARTCSSGTRSACPPRAFLSSTSIAVRACASRRSTLKARTWKPA